MPTAYFHFGASGEHECKIVCDYLGKEQYFVDGELVLQRRSFSTNGVCEFFARGHVIAVHVRIHSRGADGKAYVDGIPVADDLFSEFNAMLAHRLPWVTALIFILSAILTFLILKYYVFAA